MNPSARYDEHSDWYAEYIVGAANAHTERVTEALRTVLGPGRGRCIDIGCGTGIHSEALRELGWNPLGVDLSAGQLRHARQHVPVVLADAQQLPFADNSARAVAATLLHTDVDDWPGVVREVARVLSAGGRFAYVGVHPCFVGPFAVRDGDALQLQPGYWRTGRAAGGPGLGDGVRARVGVHHRTLADVLDAVAQATMTVRSIHESGAGAFPDILAFSAAKGGSPPKGAGWVAPIG